MVSLLHRATIKNLKPDLVAAYDLRPGLETEQALIYSSWAYAGRLTSK